MFEQASLDSLSTIAVLCTRCYPEDWGRQISSNGLTTEIINKIHVKKSFYENYKFRNYSLCTFLLFPCFFFTLTLKHSSQQPVQEIPTLQEIWVPSYTKILRTQLLKFSSTLVSLRHSQAQLFSQYSVQDISALHESRILS
jgi:hypothetical protein